MQSQQFSTERSNGAARPSRPSTNNDANLLSHSLKRMSLNTASQTPLPQSPGLNSPRSFLDTQRHPSSPGGPPSAVRRSSSVMSLNRSSSPAIGRKTSTSSLRGDMPGSPRAPPSRRSSYAPNMPSPIGAKSPLQPPPEEKKPLRAYDVAEEFFKKELALHEGVVGAATAGTVVIIHDQCYGHRFSRPKTSKSTLNMIVERPERILASVLGISAAYVRLGERHSEGSNAPHPDRNPSERIPFKIRKTSRAVDITSPVVTNVHGVKWMEELKTMCLKAGQKLASTGKELTREGASIPGQPPKEKFHEGDLYLCTESLNAFQGALGGVLDAVDAVFQGTSLGTGPSRAFVSVRPPGHHCSADFPSGFCWINNVHVGIEHAMMQYGLTHAAIIDFDLHHGDGSQEITWARNKKVQAMSKNTNNAKKTSIGYFSLHDINSFPCEWGDDDKVQNASLCIDNAHGQSIWNVHLEEWKTHDEFWEKYEQKYSVLLEKTRKYLKSHTKRLRTSPNYPAPKAAIFLSAGFDASEWETEGMQRHKVNVPTDFYARFTQDVVRLAEEEDTGAGGRVISVLEGGYSNRALSSGVLSHISGLCDGQIRSAPMAMGSSQDIRQGLAGLSMREEDFPMQTTEDDAAITYDSRWWSEDQLVELENLVDPPPVAAPKRPPKTGPPPTYSTPTQSFTAKVVDPSKVHRTVSGKFIPASPSRAPSPPPPEVDWATAAHSLSKLLIPSDRQTQSCKPEELTETKVKKEKPAPAPPAAKVAPSGRQLRGRKPATTYADPGSDTEMAAVPVVSKANRRRTIADLPQASAEPPAATRTSSRRMSIASSTASINGDRSMSRTSSVAPASNEVRVPKARKSIAPARAPKNEPPVPRVPSGYLKKPTTLKEKENDMDSLTSGLKRITLKLPPKEEYEAREKQKAAEAEKKAATKAVRKPAAPRTTKAPVAKKAVGRVSKSSIPPSPIDSITPEPVAGPAGLPAPPEAPKIESFIPPPEAPKIESAFTPPLEQPQPILPRQDSIASSSGLQFARRQSTGIFDPPGELGNMSITPDQLPKPSFTTEYLPGPVQITPPRPDTPPPPPPSAIPQFVNYNATSFGSSNAAGPQNTTVVKQEPQAPLQWLPPNTDAAPLHAAPAPVAAERPLSASSKRQDLPIFTANGAIPFAPNPNMASSAANTNIYGPGDTKPKEKVEQVKEVDIWEVPETPGR